MRKILIIIALAGLTGCKKQAEPEKEPVVPVQIAPVTRGTIQQLVTGDGIVFPVDQASVVPKISAPIKSFAVRRGDHVAKDQVLAVLENRDLEAAVAEAKQNYAQAQAAERTTTAAQIPEDANKAQQDVTATKEAMDAAQKVYESRKQLFDQGALARRLVDEADVAYVQARSQYDVASQHLKALEGVSRPEMVKSAEAQVQAVKARYDAAEAQFSYSQIHSPIAGIISDRPLFPGEMAAAGTPLLTVMNISRVIVKASIPVAQAAVLKVGMPSKITAEPGIELQGKVTVVSPAVDPNSTTVEIWSEAENPGEKLKPGATAHVAISVATLPDAVLIPAVAVLPSDEGGVRVLIVGGDSAAHEKKIEIGVREPDKVQVLKGVSPGEQVITVGGVGLDDGAKVRIVAAGEEKEAGKDEDEDDEKK